MPAAKNRRPVRAAGVLLRRTPRCRRLYAITIDARRAWRTITVAAISLLALGSAFAALTVVRAPHASLGFGISGLTVVGVAPGSVADSAGLRAGDRLGRNTPAAVRLRALWYDAYQPGQTERLTLERDGALRSVTLRAVAHAPPFDPRSRRIVELRLLAYAIFILIGALLVILRPARFTWAFFACCVGLANFPGYIGWSLTTAAPLLGMTAYVFWTAAADIASVAFLAFALRFPRDALVGWRREAWRTLPLWLGAFLAIDFWATRSWYDGGAFPDAVVWVTDAAGLLLWTIGAVSLIGTYNGAAPADRRRLQWAIAGSVIGALAWYVERLLDHAGFSVQGRLIGFATIAMPLSLAYATLKHRVVDVRFVINRALTYSVLASALVALFVLSSWFVAVTLQREHVQIAVQIVLALIVGAWLNRTHRQIESMIESLLFRRLRGAEAALARAEDSAGGVTSLDDLEALLVRAPVDGLELESAAVFRKRGDGTFVRTAHAGSAATLPDWLRAHDGIDGALTTSVQDGSDTLALVVYCAHRNGYAIDADELALLERFVKTISREYARVAARTAAARRLSELLRPPESFGDVTFASALAAHILQELAIEDRALLTVCAVLPDATLDDVVSLVQSDGAAAQLLELASSTAFVSQSSDMRFAVHSLLRPLLVSRSASWAASLLSRRAAERADARDYARAAELAAAAGDHRQALSWLEKAQLAGPLPPALEALVTEVSVREVAACPKLVIARARRKWLVESDARLCAAALEALDAVRERADRAELAAWVAVACAESGNLAYAERALEWADDFGAAARALIAAKRGGLDQSERIARDAERCGASRGGLPAAALVRATVVERARGRWAQALALLDQVLEGATEPPLRLTTLAESAFTAWLAGDDERSSRAAQALLQSADECSVHVLDCVARAFLGDSVECAEHLLPRFAAYAHLVQGVRALSSPQAEELLRAALFEATTACEPLLRVLAHVCLHERAMDDDSDCLAEAAALVDAAGSEPLSEAIAGIIGAVGDGGMLGALLARVRNSGTAGARVRLEIATATVRRGTEPVAVSERELALLLALGRSALPQPAASLVDVLWPDFDEENGARALQTCAYRVRQRLGAADAIEFVAQGYRLGGRFSVDLGEAERYVRGLADGDTLTPFDRLRLQALARQFGLPRPAQTQQWEWYDPLERRVSAVARVARLRLATHCLGIGELRRALRYAEDMLADDDLDEAARDIVLRVHAASANGPERHRELRRFEELLASD